MFLSLTKGEEKEEEKDLEIRTMIETVRAVYDEKKGEQNLTNDQFQKCLTPTFKHQCPISNSLYNFWHLKCHKGFLYCLHWCLKCQIFHAKKYISMVKKWHLKCQY